MRSAFPFFVAFTVTACIANGQLFYNEARDKKAQDAEAAAKKIASGALLEKELHNVDVLARLQISGQLNLARAEWLSDLDAFTTWSDVTSLLNGVKAALRQPPQMTADQRKARLAEIKTKQAQLKAAIAALKKPEHQGTIIETILDHLDQGESVVQFAEKLVPSENKKVADAFDRLETALDVAKSLYDSWKQTIGGVRAIQEGLDSLFIPPEQLEAELLRLEEQYLNQLGIIAARQEMEAGEVLALIEQAEGQMRTARVQGNENIEDTLRATKDRDLLFFRLHVLHTAAAVATRKKLPVFLAELRETQETLRLGIRQDSAAARSHEQVLLASSQRLAMYYKGGIKPGQLAQFLYSVSGLVSLPIIAAK